MLPGKDMYLRTPPQELSMYRLNIIVIDCFIAATTEIEDAHKGISGNTMTKFLETTRGEFTERVLRKCTPLRREHVSVRSWIVK